MRKRILQLCLGFLVGLPLLVSAQGTVTGTVTEAATGDPLPSVNVVVVGTTIGATTDINGNYTIEQVPAGEQTIEARFIGFRQARQTVNVTSGGTVTVNLQLAESAIDLDEVVVTGAGGPVEKRKLGNSIASIDVSAIENAPVQNFSEILSGREPGIVGLPSGGITGEGTRIRIRGSASLSQSNEPIVYVDGVRVDRGGGSSAGTHGMSRLDDINPDAIARIEVLKGAAAATLYGTEASNGVIQIFTKQGNVGAPRFSFQVQGGAVSYPDVFPENYAWVRPSLLSQMQTNLNEPGLKQYDIVSRPYTKNLFDTGMRQVYSASVSGGAPGVTYFINARYLDEDGPLGATDAATFGFGPGESALASDTVQRFNLSANVNAFPSDKLQIRTTLGYTDTGFTTFENNNNIFGVGSLAMFGSPHRSTPDNIEGTIAFATVGEALQQTNQQAVEKINASVGMNYRPLETLTLDGTFGIDVTNQRDNFVRPFGWNIDSFTGRNTQGFRSFSDRNHIDVTMDMKGTLRNQLTETLESTVLFGGQGFIIRDILESGSGTNFPSPGLDVVNAASDLNTSEFIQEVVNLGVFAQWQVGYKNFVFATIGARYDANSAFGEDFSGVLYPKVQASFIPSDLESWSPIGPINSLRVRVAWGQSGLQPGAFDALTTFSPFASETGPGLVPANLGNPNLKPEVSSEWEVGTEFGLFNERVGLEMTYWNRTVQDALVDKQFPVTGGFVSRQLDNIGEISAQGLEVSVNGLAYSNENMSVNLFANASYLHEEITDMGGAAAIKVGGSYPRYRNFLLQGYAPGTNFGARLLPVQNGFLPVDFNGDGNADSEADVLAHLGGLTPSTASLPNSTTVVLLDDEDGDGDALDHFLGKPTPDWQGSFGGSINFGGNFRISTLFEYKVGNFYINNLTDAFRNANPAIGRNTIETVNAERDYVTGGVDASGNPQNDANVRLQALKEWLGFDGGYGLLALSPFSGLNTIKKADWLRWRELSFTYTLGRETVSNLGLRNASISLSARNLALFTGYDGLDPEINAVGRGSGSTLSQNFLDGVEAFGIPIPRTFLVTLRFGL